MYEQCVVGVYDSLEQAERGVRTLERGGFPIEQASLIASGLRGRPGLEAELAIEDDSVRDAAIGAGLGGVLGVLVGIGAIVVTGVGAVFFAGPVAGGLTAGIVGAFLGSMAGWGVHHQHIEHYEECVKKGKVLVIAHGSPLDLTAAERILRETDAAEVRLHARSGSESPEVLGRPAPAGVLHAPWK